MLPCPLEQAVYKIEDSLRGRFATYKDGERIEAKVLRELDGKPELVIVLPGSAEAFLVSVETIDWSDDD